MWNENNKINETYTYYDVDILKSGENKGTWLLKNESNHYGHSGTDRRSQLKPITQVCIEDSFTIAIPIFTDSGILVDQ